MLEKWLKPGPAEAALLQLSRIASALEQLAELKALELRARGISTSTDLGEGEVLESDPDQLLALELEEERIRQNGLAPGLHYKPLSPDGRGWPPIPAAEPEGHLPNPPAAASLGAAFGPSQGSWAFPVGPEGAETFDAPPPESGRA